MKRNHLIRYCSIQLSSIAAASLKKKDEELTILRKENSRVK